MSASSAHPDIAELQRSIETGLGDRAIAAHLRSCPLCATLALSFEPVGSSCPVDAGLYVDKKPLRSGGMGRTFTARDVRIGREVVIKEPAEPSNSSDPGASLRMERRLLRERRILGAIEHPAVVPIYESGQWPDGTPFFAMRRILGPTLGEVIAGAPAFAQRIVLLPQFITIAEAIAHSHARGIVHRDLTPDNMMLGPLSEPYVIDWGIATSIDSREDPTLDVIEPAADGMTQGGVGKEPYAPPEQIAGAPARPTFDVYSLGVTLHHLLGGKPPRRRRDGTLEPLPRIVPEELVSIVRRATAVRPAERFADAGELARELRRYEQGKIVEAHRYTMRERARRWLRRNRSIATAVLAVVVAGVAVGAANRWRRESDDAHERASLAQSNATVATAERLEAEQRAAVAGQNRDAAMQRWAAARSQARALTQALERQRFVSKQEAERLERAIEEERAAAEEAMQKRLDADAARHDAEAAAHRAQLAEQRAIDAAHTAEQARRAAELRAEEAETRAALAERAAATAREEAQRSIAQATEARRLLEESAALVSGRRPGEAPAPTDAARPDPATRVDATARAGDSGPRQAETATPAPHAKGSGTSPAAPVPAPAAAPAPASAPAAASVPAPASATPAGPASAPASDASVDTSEGAASSSGECPPGSDSAACTPAVPAEQ